MVYRLKVARQALKHLEKLPATQRERLVRAILALEQDPFPPGKKWRWLQDSGGPVRLRVGDYRVLYDVLDDEVHVLLVIHRRDLDRHLRRG